MNLRQEVAQLRSQQSMENFNRMTNNNNNSQHNHSSEYQLKQSLMTINEKTRKRNNIMPLTRKSLERPLENHQQHLSEY